MRRLVVFGAVACAAAAARADRYEAAAALHVWVGGARVGDEGAAAVTVPTVGAGLRLSHAWHNALAWDLQLGGGVTQPATYPDAERIIFSRPEHGRMTRRTLTAAAQLGATLAPWPRYTPTVRIAIGPQVRRRGASDLGTFIEAIPAETSVDLVASVGLGFDLRLWRWTTLGVAAQLDHAVPLDGAAGHDVIAVTVRLSRAWYPRLWGPSW